MLSYVILVTLLLSSFIKPDLMEGRGLVNNITSFVKIFFCIEFLIKLKQILADRLNDRFINTNSVDYLEEIIKNNMELGWEKVGRQMTYISHPGRVFVWKTNKLAHSSSSIPLGKFLIIL
jgi:hypothetical protein